MIRTMETDNLVGEPAGESGRNQLCKYDPERLAAVRRAVL